MRFARLALFALLVDASSASAPAVRGPQVFRINGSAPVARVDVRFLSVTMDGHAFDGGDAMPFWKPASALTRLLAGALAPAYIRFGGNSHSHLTYNMTGGGMPPALPPLPAPAYQPPAPTTLMTRGQWDAIAAFCTAVGWTNVFALNALQRVADGSRSGRWDADLRTSAAAALLNYTFSQPWGATVAWELANEPDLFHYSYNLSDHGVCPVPPAQLVRDHTALRELIDETRRLHSSSSSSSSSSSPSPPPLVVGPDVANAGPTGGARFWAQYFGNESAQHARAPGGGGGGVGAASWHHYYGSAKTATAETTHDPAVLDKLITQQLAMQALLQKQLAPPPQRAAPAPAAAVPGLPPVWLGETSSFYGGGAANISDRYGAGFTWLDKLGAAARTGVSVVCRQAWMGGAYSLVEYTSFRPLPDYWASVLHKRLVGAAVLDVEGSLHSSAVLDVEGSLQRGRDVRVWASCAAPGAGAPAGAVALVVLNTNNGTSASVSPELAGAGGAGSLLDGGWDEYLLTPADAAAGLSSPSVALNGIELGVVAGPALPSMPPAKRSGAAIVLPPLTFGFFVLRSAGAAACL